MHHKIDKVELLKHLAFIVCVGIISACVSIILCLCVNFAYHINQTYAWTLFLLPLLGVLSLALYKALKLPYDYSTDTLVDQMRENDVVLAYTCAGHHHRHLSHHPGWRCRRQGVERLSGGRFGERDARAGVQAQELLRRQAGQGAIRIRGRSWV